VVYAVNGQGTNPNGNPGRGTVSVINGRTRRVIATVRVGHTPIGIAVDPRTNTAYVVNSNGNDVSVISGKTDTVIATIPVGRGPEGVAVDPGTDAVYVTNNTDSTVSVIDPKTNVVTSTIAVGHQPLGIAVGEFPQGVAVDARNCRVYVAHEMANTVSVLGH
jgi:YVTN family beta-propeller protein